MTPEEVRTIDRVIGGLQSTVATFQQTWAEQDRKATEGRRYLFEKLEKVSSEVQDLTYEVKSVVRDVAEMKPAVTDWVTTKATAMGAKTAASILGKATYLLVGGVIALIGWALSHFSPGFLR